MPSHRPSDKDANLHTSKKEAADLLNVSPRLVAAAHVVREQGTPDLIATVESGAMPLGFVIVKNLKRRHLDESQRAMVAAVLANMQSGANVGNRNAVKDKNECANLYTGTPRISQADAAELLNVSRGLVNAAR